MRWPVARGLIFLALVACRTPAPPRAAPKATLATEDTVQIWADVTAVNRAGDIAWRPIESHRLYGLAFERYQLADGPTLLLVLGGASPAVDVQVWFDAGTKDDGVDFGRTAALLDAVRDGRSVPGAHRSGVAWHLAYWATTTSPEHVDAALAATKERRPADAAWDVIQGRRGAWTADRLLANVERAATQRAAADKLERDELGQAAAAFEPGRSTLVIAGAIERRDILARVGAVYAQVERPTDEADKVWEPPVAPRAPFELKVPGAVRRSFVWWPLAEASAADHVAIETIAAVLAGRIAKEASPSGITAVAVRHRPGATGSLTVEMELADTMTATAAARRVERVVKDISAGGTTGREIERALATARGRRLARIARIDGRATTAARAFLEHGALRALADEAAVLEVLGERDLRRVAKEQLGKRRPTIVLTRPERSAP
ncbi:MAG: hypothetical protein RIT81_29795 [Deltaproteobacteria bacterium]